MEKQFKTNLHIEHVKKIEFFIFYKESLNHDELFFFFTKTNNKNKQNTNSKKKRIKQKKNDQRIDHIGKQYNEI